MASSLSFVTYVCEQMAQAGDIRSVSYTHLDVYKRQDCFRPESSAQIPCVR